MDPADIGKILDEIGKRIGPAGEHVWQVLIRQVFVEGILNLLLGVVFLMAGAALVKMSHRGFTIPKNDRYDDGPIMRGIIWGVLASIGLTIGGTNFYFGVLYLINPEYEAIIRLLNAVAP